MGLLAHDTALLNLRIYLLSSLLYLPFTNATGEIYSLSEVETGKSCTPISADYLMFELHLEDFLEVRETKAPSCFDWTSDGCSKVPHSPFGFHFAPSCWRHDFGYRNLKTQHRFNHNNRERVDRNFMTDLNKVCSNYGKRKWMCNSAAFIYFTGVRVFGSPTIAWWASLCAWTVIIVTASAVIYFQARKKRKRLSEEEKNPDYEESPSGVPVRSIKAMAKDTYHINDVRR
jgi:hypothetical protein